MKRILTLLFSFLLCLCIIFPASADNEVSKISIEVFLEENGAMEIHQVWNGTFDEGTECYYPFKTQDRLEITNFTVRDQFTTYQTLEEWDVDASFFEKAGKCGLNEIDNGYEVCWGISQYGDNRYEITYRVENAVGGYTDTDGFNFRFINPEMNTTPTSADITISLANGELLSDQNCNIWAFGYDGPIEFQDGKVVAYTQSDLGYDNHMTLMLELEKGLLSPIYTESTSFETVKERAFDGSDYEDDTVDWVFLIFFLSIILICSVLLLTLLIREIILKCKLRRFKRNCKYRRGVPKNGINRAYAMLFSFKDCKENAIVSARILRLILSNSIEPITDENGIFGKKVRFRVLKCSDSTDEYDQKLFHILKASAGEDGILEPREMKKYNNDYPKKLRNLLSSCINEGLRDLKNDGCTKKRKFSYITQLTEKGKQELAELYGLKKYLEDFSLIDERELKETMIWQQYMVYAALFGIADKVAKQLKKILPEAINEIEQYERNITCSDLCCYHMYNAMTRRERADAAKAVARASGSGGSASFGGGGGFSGGGFGGGTR